MRLELPPPRTYVSAIRLQFRASPVAGHLLVLDTNPAGERCRSSQRYVWSHESHRGAPPAGSARRLKATDPGPGLPLAVVTADPVDLSRLWPQQLDDEIFTGDPEPERVPAASGHAVAAT